MSQYYPPPPGVDRRQNASRNYPPPPPANAGYGSGSGSGDSYRPPPPPSYNAPPPPPPSGYDSYAPGHRGDQGSRYSRNDRNDRNDRYQPSRRTDNHPLPPRPSDAYPTFNGSDSFRPPQGDFNFRSEKPRGVGDSYNSYRPGEHRSRADPPRGPARGPHNDRPPYRPSGNRGRGAYAGRRPWRPFIAADRAILHTTDNNKPTEDFADAQNGVTYRALDQLSDSDEADMDISDDENDSAQPSAKRARTAGNSTSADEAPKWSNPDPYTALPPEQDPDKKKKDVVQLIRKARVEPAKSTRTSLLADDEDFIRCDSGSEDDGDEEEFIDPLTYSSQRSNNQGAPRQPAAAAPAAPATSSASNKAATASAAAPTNKAAKRVEFDMDLPRSSDLGSRKRTHDDVLKLPAHAQLKTAPKRPSGGSIVSEWRVKKGENHSPWVTSPSPTSQINVRYGRCY